jgi:hypothetical protein
MADAPYKDICTSDIVKEQRAEEKHIIYDTNKIARDKYKAFSVYKKSQI